MGGFKTINFWIRVSDSDQFSPSFSIFSSDEHMAQYFPQTRLMDCH